ncbi:uncharacterized protein LOC143276159 [Babylonia areolata]|uniref:uncharacterized protein LOC143276159 n=1 Tax=Babylonia areolata TaxID=304850 RepID=UPI003FD2789F
MTPSTPSRSKKPRPSSAHSHHHHHHCRTLTPWLTLTLLTLYALSAATWAQDEEIVNSTTLECEEVMVPMCRGLVGYNYTRLPNRFNHTSQQQVYWALQPWWPFIDMGCSDNLRTFLCALYLPRCTPGVLGTDLPCRKTCTKARSRCSALVGHHGLLWGDHLDCASLSGTKKSQSCVRSKRETNKKRRRQIAECQPNPVAMCQNMPYTLGSLPNPFMQSDLDEIVVEMQQYSALVESGCSGRLPFLLCGAFMPFCIHGPLRDRPYVVPCREVCHQVRHDCRRQFHDSWAGLPWPAKLHCHRYPSHHTSNYLQEGNTTAPCAMPPVGV